MTFRAWLESICILHHHREAPMPLSPDTREEAADLAGGILARWLDDGLTEEEALARFGDLADALVQLPEPLDTLSDIAMMRAFKWVAGMLRLDPEKMEARARDKVAEAGRSKGKRRRRLLQRAAELRKRAEAVRTRQEN